MNYLPRKIRIDMKDGTSIIDRVTEICFKDGILWVVSEPEFLKRTLTLIPESLIYNISSDGYIDEVNEIIVNRGKK